MCGFGIRANAPGHALGCHECRANAGLRWPGSRCHHNDHTAAAVTFTSASCHRTKIASVCPTAASWS
jgi:hypothetical protein